MTLIGGGTSGGHGSSPPPPAPSSYPSTLSPLAPPFTVGQPPLSRRFAADPDRNRLHPWSSSSSAATPQWSLFDSPGAPYYPRYTPSVGAADDTFEPLPGAGGCGGAGAGRWSGPFDCEDAGGSGGSSWIEPSLGYKDPSFQEGAWQGKHISRFARKEHFGSECLEWLHKMHSAIYEENAIAPCNIGESVLAPSALPKGMSYSQLPDSSSKFSSNCSYDGYMGYPAKTCSTSAQVHAPSSRRTNSSMDSSMSKNGYLIIQPVDPYRIDADRENHILTNLKELNINQNVEIKEGNDEWTRANDMKKHTNMPVDPFPLKTGLPSGNEIATGNSIGSSTESKSGLKLKPLNLRSAFISEGGPAEPNDSMGSSSQTLDQLNLAVDSPCWKGASVSRQSPFGLVETVDPHSVVNEWKDCDDLDHGQEHLSLGVAYSETLPLEQVGTLISDENKKASSESSLRESPVVILPSIQRNLDDANKAGPDCLKDDKEKGIYCSDTCKEQNNEVGKDQNGDSEAKDNEAIRLGKEETAVSSNQPMTGNGVDSLETDLKAAVQNSSPDVNPHGKPSFLGNSIQLFLKTMHSLSEVLLSSYHGDGLKEHDHELLQLTIHNLEAFSLRNKKDTGLKADVVMNNTNNNTTHDMKGKMLFSAPSMNNVYKGGITEFSKMVQASEKTSIELEENPEALVYKNLWVEAEAALCSKKYELQLARMKIEMEDLKPRPPTGQGKRPSAGGHASPTSEWEHVLEDLTC